MELFNKKEWALGCRVRHNIGQNSFQVDNKALYSWKNWKVNGYNTLDITNKLLVKSGLLIARTHAKEDACKCDWFVRLEGAKQPGKLSVRQFFESFFLSVTEQVTDTQKVGFEARVSSKNLAEFLRRPWGGADSFWVASEWKSGNTTVKARVNPSLTHAITVKNKLGSMGSYSLGF